METERVLAGRTAVVTGASSGIGRAVAETFGAAGAHVVLVGRTASAMAESVARIEAAGGTARAEVADVRDPAAVPRLVEGAVAETGGLDVMVNNAGLSHPGTVVDGEPEQWRAMLETNVLALLVGCQAAVRAMRATGRPGHIVNVSSVAALRPDSAVYGATKHAVNTISETLRRELQEEPIRVVTVMPGAVATNFARHFDPGVVQGLAATAGAAVEIVPGERLPDEVLAAAQAALPDHLCSPQDVADAVLWAVTRPPQVHVAQLVVRPRRDLNL